MKSPKCLVAAVCFVVVGALPLSASKAPAFPNATKYKNGGAQPATGRSGSAGIEVRALRGKTETDIEVTTGQLDAATAPVGNLDKVQLKLYGPNGDVLVTDNYRKSALSGGYGIFTYDSAYRGQHVQAQANVSGIDPTRTDVVTVEETVKMRPDLSVGSLQAPVRATVNTNVTIAAVVTEANRDVGAHANCVLRIDGIAVDQANGIWVDVGDSVTCEFTHLFTSVGVKQFSVDVTSVIPGDYDEANNHASAQIEIVDPTVPVSYNITAEDAVRAGHTEYHQHTEWQAFDGGTSYVSDNNSVEDYETRAVGYEAFLTIGRPITFPVLVESAGVSDGQTFLSTSFTLDATYTYSASGYTVTCGSSFEMDRWFQVCTSRTIWNGEERVSTNVFTGYRSGSVTYYSNATSSIRYDDGSENVYSYNYWSESPLGPQPPPTIGNHVEIRAAVTDASGTYDAVAAVDLYPIDEWYTPPDSCYSWDDTYSWGRWSGYGCSGFWSHLFGRHGYRGGVDQQ